MVEAQLVVFEDAGWRDLLPLCYWRAAFDLRCGAESLLERIERRQSARAVIFARPELADVLRGRQDRDVNCASDTRSVLFVNGRALLQESLDLPLGSAVWWGSSPERDPVLLAAHVQPAIAARLSPEILLDSARTRAALEDVATAPINALAAELIQAPWDLVRHNPAALRQHADDLPRRPLPPMNGVHVLNQTAVHIAADAVIKPGVVLDAESGPIIIAESARISPNVTIQGPAYIGRQTLVQPGAVIREATSIGACCKVGGEIEGTIIHGYSNKQHHGFLGHAYVAEWVNLGAGTCNSDLKNTYGSIRVALTGTAVDTRQMFVGSFIADHAKTAINVALPTGAVVGFASNVIVSRFAEKFTPSFSWCTDDGRTRYDPARALDVARKVMARRMVKMSAAEEVLFMHLAQLAATIERTNDVGSGGD